MQRVVDDSLADRATELGFALGWRSGRLLDTAPARAAFDAVADLGWRRGGAGPRQLRNNLARVLGPRTTAAELDAVTRRGLRSYARYFREVFWMPTARSEAVSERTDVTGTEHLEAIRARGRGVVCALPHSGNWDAAAVTYLTRWGGPLAVVAERLRPETLYRRFQIYRESLGMTVLPLTGGPRPAAAALAATLRAGGTVCLLCERDLSSSGVPVSMFGQPLTVPPGPALLAEQTGAGLLPTVAGFDGDDWTIRFFPEVFVDGVDAPKRLRDKVTHAMQLVVDDFAVGIAQAPQDWHMLQPLWQSDREPTGALTS